jgi:hypothetical protein
VIDDLWLTGCVDSVSYIDRPWVPRDAKNATGDTLITDGRIAIVRLNDRANPHRADVADSSLPHVKEKANPVERFGRNTVLYLRDDFGRGNIVYQGYSGIKTVWGMTHKPKEPVAGPKMLHVGGEPYESSRAPVKVCRKADPKIPASSGLRLCFPACRNSVLCDNKWPPRESAFPFNSMSIICRVPIFEPASSAWKN